MRGKTTLPEMYWHLMLAPSESMDAIENADHCVICGRSYPLNRHHIVPRSAGEMYDEDGNRMRKPVAVTCGIGNHLPYCHGMIHHRMLHLDYRDGGWKYLYTKEETKYQAALMMDGWRPIHDEDAR